MTIPSSLLRNWSKSRKGLLLCHDHADVDSLATAAALQLILGKKWAIGIAGKISQNALSLAQRYDVAFISRPALAHYDSIICCDFSSYEMAGPLRAELEPYSFNQNVSILDHHEPSDDSIRSNYSLIDPACLSSCEIVCALLKKTKKKITTRIADLLICGILSDTYYLHTAKSSTFETLSQLLSQTKTPYDQLRELVESSLSFSERLAVLKSAKRITLYRSQDYITVFAVATFFQAACANRLIQSGADLAIASGTDERGQTLLSARINERFMEELDFNLARDLIKPLVRQLGGSGGGHAKAASYRADQANPVTLLDAARRLIEKKAQQEKTGFSLIRVGD